MKAKIDRAREEANKHTHSNTAKGYVSANIAVEKQMSIYDRSRWKSGLDWAAWEQMRSVGWRLMKNDIWDIGKENDDDDDDDDDDGH